MTVTLRNIEVPLRIIEDPTFIKGLRVFAAFALAGAGGAPKGGKKQKAKPMAMAKKV